MINGNVAVVTGASRGIGRAIVRMLAKEGCHVAFNYLKSKEEAKALEAETRKFGVKCEASCVDIRDFDAVKHWIDATKKTFGQVDILVNNAGILMDKALMLMSPEEWAEVVNTNLTGMYNATRLCIVGLLKQKRGHVINISSVAGITGLARQANYAATKGGMIAFTKALAKEVASYGIRVNAVAPGYIETDMLSNLKDEQKNDITRKIPLGRIGTPEDIARCVKFLLSEEAQYIVGQVIQVDGGLAIR